MVLVACAQLETNRPPFHGGQVMEIPSDRNRFKTLHMRGARRNEGCAISQAEHSGTEALVVDLSASESNVFRQDHAR
ncbi:hypothetical protein COMA2_180086 [Candidatus Nitrospira nitrificans]|uniref:Uncharacterized protein n=1 Tax=Candidatus Nitrospira nitrificans TaxID=1742973 RepID=A0A0S4LDM3_9BACT|nr:hypothetical protein COMA2_180086 [Candidatus Nitrospira nitrificans]